MANRSSDMWSTISDKMNIILYPLGVVLVAAAVYTITRGIQRKRNGANWANKESIDLSRLEEEKLAKTDREKESGAATDEESADLKTRPISVNYHFTRQCNYKCGFCFHTAKTSFVLPLEEAKRGLKLLAEKGMEKLNFSGGEPFITDRGRFVGELTRYCKEELGLNSVSIVSNGSLIKEKWFREYGEYLDILAVSCDSFNPETNKLIGRQQGQRNHLESLMRVREWCRKYKVAFKLNSVINVYNKDEDMVEEIKRLDPCRWKVFQCLLLEGENCGEDSIRHAETFVISKEDFQNFINRHKEVGCLVPECNEKMQNSYLILDEYMRFLNCSAGKKTPSRSLLDVGVEAALDDSGFDERMFLKRGGKYTWTKADMKLEW